MLKVRDKLKVGGSKVVSAAMAGVLAVGLMPLPAFANDLTSGSVMKQATLTAQAGKAMSADGYVIAAAYAAANPAPEILGLNNPNQRYTNEGDQTYAFFGDGDINENPDPYLYNYKNGFTPGIYIGGRQGSPMSALEAYDADDGSAAQNAVWALRPHIILGTGSDAIPKNEADFYDTAAYARVVETALGLPANSYKPIGVTYNRTTLSTMIQTMYRLASAANKAKGTTLKTRYEDPVEIAKDYERYILGQKGLVRQAIDSGKEKEKTIALVESYNSSSKTYTIITDGVAEGTATTNRYLEAVQGVTYNYFNSVSSASGATTVTADQLKDNVDAIIIGGNAGTESGTLADYLSKDGLLDKTYYCTNWANGSAFGTTVNSVENAQNVGRILPFVYPKILDQSDMIAYYYDTFYHLKDGAIDKTIGDRMDGVRNAEKQDSQSYTTWESSDVKGYDRAKVEASLVTGVGYLNSITDGTTPEYLKPTNNVSGDTLKNIDMKDVKVTVSAQVGETSPNPVVTYGSKTLTKDTDYSVAYGTSGDNKGTVTVTGIGSYTGSKTVEFAKLSAENFKTSAESGSIEVKLNKDSYTFTGSPIKPTVTVKKGEETLKENEDYIVSYSGENTKVGDQAKVTVQGITNYAGKVEQAFSITKMKPEIAITHKAGARGKEVTTDLTKKADALKLTFGDDVSTITWGATTGYDGKLAFASDNPTVAAIEAGNRGAALKLKSVNDAKDTTITITAPATDNCEGATASFKVRVGKLDKQTISVSSATNGEIIKTAGITKKFKLGAQSNGDGALTYASSDEKVATVKNGVVTVVAPGTTDITVNAAATNNAGAGSTTVKLTVQGTPQTITASDFTKVMGDPDFSIGAKSDAGGKLSYASSDTNVVTVDANGVVSIKGVGTAQITITADAIGTYEAATKVITITVTKLAAGTKVNAVSAGTGSTVSVSVNSDASVTVTGSNAKKNGTVNVNTVNIDGVDYPVSAIAAKAFKNTKAKKVTVGSNVKTIGASAFTGAKNLTTVSVGNNVTTIGKAAFQNAKKLKTVTLGKSVKSIKKNVFKGDKKLKKVTLKSSKLTKTSFKNMIKGSKIKTVKLSGVSKKAKKSYKKWAKALKVKVK